MSEKPENRTPDGYLIIPRTSRPADNVVTESPGAGGTTAEGQAESTRSRLVSVTIVEADGSRRSLEEEQRLEAGREEMKKAAEAAYEREKLIIALDLYRLYQDFMRYVTPDWREKAAVPLPTYDEVKHRLTIQELRKATSYANPKLNIRAKTNDVSKGSFFERIVGWRIWLSDES